jgi:hypothetical protein
LLLTSVRVGAAKPSTAPATYWTIMDEPAEGIDTLRKTPRPLESDSEKKVNGAYIGEPFMRDSMLHTTLELITA